MRVRTVLYLAFMVGPPLSAAAQSLPDSTRTAIRKAAEEYERLRTARAPHRLAQNNFCDEQVGTWCVVWDRGQPRELPPEPTEVTEARRRAIDAYNSAFNSAPSDSLVAAFLVRYLVEDGRAQDALNVARVFGETGENPVLADFLHGFALHALGDDARAEGYYARGLMQMTPRDRAEMHDVLMLLDKDERRKYMPLPGSQKGDYHERLWRLADPLYLTPGNESLIEHFTRRVYASMLGAAPQEPGRGFGTPETELTMRWGVAAAITKAYSPQGQRYIHHSHPNQLTYIPPAMLTKGPLPRFEPGGAWPYDTVRQFSGYAPGTLRVMNVLEHQLTRFPGEGRVRVDYVLPTDSLVRYPARFEVGLFLLDSAFAIIGEARDTVTAGEAGTTGFLTTDLPAGAAAYSLEALELDSRIAARARYAMPAIAPQPVLSDLAIISGTAEQPPASKASGDFRPFASLVLARGTPIGLYIEANGLRATDDLVRYRVDLEVMEQERPGVFSRAVRRLGQAFGIAQDEVAPRMTWEQQQPAAPVTTISLKLGAVQLEPGLKLFRVTVTDLATRQQARIERLVRVAGP